MMARPMKCRKVCHFPATLEFSPIRDESDKANDQMKEPVILAVDEYETIRLIDKEGLDQKACAEFMQIARTSVQRIYDSARKKLAESIVEGRPLRIEGGNFWLCNGQSETCGKRSCFKRTYSRQYDKPKGESIMRIAVTYENEEVFQHFGHTEQFKIYDVEDGKIVASEVVGTEGSGHGALADVLSALKVDILICGGIGGGAKMALAAAGIKIYGGVSGKADDAAKAFAEGKLNFNPDVQCDSHEHHAEGQACGIHGCGNGHCGH